MRFASHRPLRLEPHQRLPGPLKWAGLHANSRQHDLQPDARALDQLGIEAALRLCVLPMRPAGAITPVAAETRAAFDKARAALEAQLGPVAFLRMPRADITRDIMKLRGETLASRAAIRSVRNESCRDWSGVRSAAVMVLLTALTIAGAIFDPTALLILLSIWAALTLFAVTGLRTIAALVEAKHARRQNRQWTSRRPLLNPGEAQPSISLLVPLFHESAIAERLIERLGRIDYPRNRFEVLLILESDDIQTLRGLQDVTLPNWARIIRVPSGQVRTKPRAMNYALDFAQGEIIGIYDAEDAPAPDQLLKVAHTLRNAPPDVACVQGVLDFYNARQNWLTRCFAIDYAIWFRLVLPGLVRMGFPIPLGGTTVFFRRHVLDALGRWDAHNVTEDADLGLRLARRGYRVAFVPTLTEEEATSTISTWIRQRSRWIKGYAITWAVHMRDPLRLLGELGFKRFLGVQILFLGTLSQFVLAPLLWSYWLILLGLPHPATELVPLPLLVTLGGLFLLAEVATLAVAALAVATPRHNWLIKWVPLLHVYFPLAAIASWKGYFELISKPFYWDKTAHGEAPTLPPEGPAAQLPRHPA